jgi:hypothetical protein
MSGMVMLRPTRFGFCGSTNVGIGGHFAEDSSSLGRGKLVGDTVDFRGSDRFRHGLNLCFRVVVTNWAARHSSSVMPASANETIADYQLDAHRQIRSAGVQLRPLTWCPTTTPNGVA